MTYEKIISIAEDHGWSVSEWEESTRHLFEFSQESPAGEDFRFTVDSETPESLIHEVYVYAEEFDPDEHVSMWIQAKESGVSGVLNVRTLVEDADALQQMLDELSDALRGVSSCNTYEDSWFAETRCHVDDVIGIAAKQGVNLTREQAVQWWEANQKHFRERLTEFGNEILSSAEWEFAFCHECGRMLSEDETSRLLNAGTKQEQVVCKDCFDSMWGNNEISLCAHCGCWYDVSLLKSDPEPVGGDTFTACPGCGRDIVDGLTRTDRLAEAQPAEQPNEPQYAVTFLYTPNRDPATYLFSDEQSAKWFLRDNYECEVETMSKKSLGGTYEISDDGLEAHIVTKISGGADETIDMFISPIYQ